MKTPSPTLLVPAAALALALLAAAPAVAGPRWQEPSAQSGGEVFQPIRQGRQLSLREVVQIIEGSVPGRLSDAQLVYQGQRAVYLIRWEASEPSARGRIILFTVDAETGQILSRRGG